MDHGDRPADIAADGKRGEGTVGSQAAGEIAEDVHRAGSAGEGEDTTEIMVRPAAIADGGGHRAFRRR